VKFFRSHFFLSYCQICKFFLKIDTVHWTDSYFLEEALFKSFMGGATYTFHGIVSPWDTPKFKLRGGCYLHTSWDTPPNNLPLTTNH